MININCGILGHVDSGKTSLYKILNQISSTNAFDKNPQSYEIQSKVELNSSSIYEGEGRGRPSCRDASRP